MVWWMKVEKINLEKNRDTESRDQQYVWRIMFKSVWIGYLNYSYIINDRLMIMLCYRKSNCWNVCSLFPVKKFVSKQEKVLIYYSWARNKSRFSLEFSLLGIPCMSSTNRKEIYQIYTSSIKKSNVRNHSGIYNNRII